MAVKFVIAVVFFICLFMTLESRSVGKVSQLSMMLFLYLLLVIENA